MSVSQPYDKMPWEQRLREVSRVMREISTQHDPSKMSDIYGAWVSQTTPMDRFLALSRRDLESPRVRVTRSSLWSKSPNPWTQRSQLPLLEGGVLSELIWGDEPVLNNDFHPDPADPAHEHLAGMRSLFALPNFENGQAINMNVILRREPNAFDPELAADNLWKTNLFGRATKNLVLSLELRNALNLVDRELKVVADLQRAMLPRHLPEITGLTLAAYYETCTRAGGDYYDFFPLPDGRVGMLIADVAGHGAPAAVLMAVVHALAHTHEAIASAPAELLSRINRTLAERYTDNGTFVTAFYGVYDPKTRMFDYANAGHNPPRLIRNGNCNSLSLVSGENFPLGIALEERYGEHQMKLEPGDCLVLYTDGIVEARNPGGVQFGTERLDPVLSDCNRTAEQTLKCVMEAVNTWTNHAPPSDDRTLVIGRLT